MKAGLAVALLVSAALATAPAFLTGPVPESPDDVPFECEDLVDGEDIKVEAGGVDMGVEREMEIEVEADTRFRADVELEEESATDGAATGTRHGDDSDDDEGDDPSDDDSGDREDEVRTERESRVELCGFVQFVDEDGDGMLDVGETIVDATLVAFDDLTHTVAGEYVFVATSAAGLTVTVHIPEPFPAADVPLIRWSVEANPTCAAGATHYAVKLEQEGTMDQEAFLVAACGSVLQASGEA